MPRSNLTAKQVNGLAVRWKAGDSAAFDELWTGFLAPYLGRLRTTCDALDADTLQSIANDVAIEALRSWDPQRAGLKTFVITVWRSRVANALSALKRYRRKIQSHCQSLNEPTESLEGDTGEFGDLLPDPSALRSDEVAIALEEWPSKVYTPVKYGQLVPEILRLWSEGLTRPMIVRRLRCAPGTVYNAIWRLQHGAITRKASK